MNKYLCPYADIQTDLDHELIEEAGTICCACGFKGPEGYLDPIELKLRLKETEPNQLDYSLPQELVEEFNKVTDLKICMDAATENWSTRKALKYAKMYRTARDNAWNNVYELHPELKHKDITFAEGKLWDTKK